MITASDFQSYAGPGDRNLPMGEVQGYQPVSRIGEVVMNAFGAPLPFQLTHTQPNRTLYCTCLCKARCCVD